MNLQFGYSTGIAYDQDISLSELLDRFIEMRLNSVELMIANEKELDQISLDDISKIKKSFEHISVHGLIKGITYSEHADAVLDRLTAIMAEVNAAYVVVHPDLIDDIDWLYAKLGSKLAIENMDNRKDFGQCVADLKSLFASASDARWICDLNHVYTVDLSMKLAKSLHTEFGDRLVGYHVSGYEGGDRLHVGLKTCHMPFLLESVENLEVPIIHEGFEKDAEFLVDELSFVNKTISQIRHVECIT